ncbi:MAG: zinc metallopeptidase [Pseudomonadota bacterium]
MPFIILVALLVVGLIAGPALWVRHVLKKYANPPDRYPMSGGEAARHLLDLLDLQSVRVEPTETGDHYNPVEKVVRLTDDKFSGHSLTAVTVAAHEVGHAVQDAEGYTPHRLRNRLVRWTAPLERAGAGLLMLTPILVAITRAPGVGGLTLLGGLLALGSGALVHLVTLPTEIDASFGRALPLMEKHQLLIPGDERHARKLLQAAALTYVSASLMSLLNIGRWWAILRR